MRRSRFPWFPWQPRQLAPAGGTIVGLVAIATATAGLLEVRALTRELNRSPALRPGPQITAAQAGKPQTILLLGSDRRFASGEEGAFSDTIILVRLDPSRGATAVMSIPRDLKARIEVAPGDVRLAKITEAFALGGPALTLKTVKQGPRPLRGHALTGHGWNGRHRRSSDDVLGAAPQA